MKSAWSAALALCVLCGPAAAQEQEDVVTLVKKTASGAVYEEKMGIDGSLVSESFQLTRLTCTKGSAEIALLMPIDRTVSDQETDSTLKQKNGVWHLSLQVGKTRVEKMARFVKINDPVAQPDEGVEVTLTYGDAVWKALLAPQGDQLMALAGYSVYVSVGNGAKLKSFKRFCGLK